MSNPPTTTTNTSTKPVQPHPTLRVARPTTSIHSILPFYTTGLGFTILYEFQNHDGFDGVMLGHPGSPYHFEFTCPSSPSSSHPGHVPSTSPSEEEPQHPDCKSTRANGSAGLDPSTPHIQTPESTRAPTKDNLLVFYLPDAGAWEAAVERMRKAGFEAVEPVNRYWERGGRTFEDGEGWRVVLQRGAWRM